MVKKQPKLQRITKPHKGDWADLGYFYLSNPTANVTITKDEHARVNVQLDITDYFPLTKRPQPMRDSRHRLGLQVEAKNLEAVGKIPGNPKKSTWLRGLVVYRLCYMLTLLCGSPEAAMLTVADVGGVSMYGLPKDAPPKTGRKPGK